MAKTNSTNISKPSFSQKAKNSLWHIRRMYKKTLIVGDGKNTSSKLKTFVYTMVVGAIFILSFLWIFTGNPFTSFSAAWEKFHQLTSNADRLYTNIAIFGLAGVAVAIGFKTGLFNMGVSGQMLFGGMLAGIVALHAGSSVPTGVGQILIILICILGSMTFSAFAGFLKAYFRIHEVVSTIMLNWIAFLLLQAVVKDLLPDTLLAATKTSSITFSDNFSLKYETIGSYGITTKAGGLIALLLLAVAAVGTWVLLYKTSLGHKMQMVGKNKDAALAAGINVKNITVASMAISGAVSGILASVVFFIRDLNLKSQLADVVPTEGFDGIAIAIVAFSNPIAIIPVAVIFGFLQSMISMAPGVDVTFINVATGLLLLISALSAMFFRWNARLLIYKVFIGKEAFKNYLNFKGKSSEVDKKHFENYEELKLNSKIRDFNNQILIPHYTELSTIKGNFWKQQIPLVKNYYRNLPSNVGQWFQNLPSATAESSKKVWTWTIANSIRFGKWLKNLWIRFTEIMSKLVSKTGGK